jgi:hypothetical protein
MQTQPTDTQSVIYITTAFEIDGKYKVNIDNNEKNLKNHEERLVVPSGKKYIYITYKMQSATMNLEAFPKQTYHLKVVKLPNGEIKIIKI